MMTRFDLHIHTNHSDGMFSPSQVVDLAIEQGLNGIAITDHDTITGIEEAINHSLNYNDFKVIPGIEFSCVYRDEEVHILGYFIDYKDPNIINMTNRLKSARINRGLDIIKKINGLGLNLTIEEVKDFSGDDYIGRPHIARALIKNGYVYTIQEAFDKYLNRGKPAYVERYKMTIEDTISLIKDGGGISILAHPGLLKDKSIVKHCISLDIDGIECIHSKHSRNDTKLFLGITNENRLIATGGSDCHGDLTGGTLLLGKYFIDIDSIPEMKERI